LNAALGCAQMEQLDTFIEIKRKIARLYEEWCAGHGLEFAQEPADSRSNYWLNTIILESQDQRDALLAHSNSHGVAIRPAWIPMHRLEMNQYCYSHNLENTERLSPRMVNIPSSHNANV
jgi:dTDP-4-amino-4,6-dideoxygalactose transaminase